VKIKLKEIATVQMGYSFRARLEQLDAGGVAVIQMKDLTDRNRVACQELARVDLPNLKEHHRVQPNDLVFRSRGLSPTSALLTEDPGPAVVAAPLLRIRANHKSVLPEYLNWFIHQPLAQAFFTSRAKGTAQQMISKQALDELEVYLPSLAHQQQIVELTTLAEVEQELLRKLAEKRHHYLSATLMKLTLGE